MVTASGMRAVARCDALGAFSEQEDGLFRPYLSGAHRATLDRLFAWMAEAGMTVRLDAAANLIGRYEGQAPGAPALLIGSHIDSVRDAGRYDGPLGIMLGIECVAALHATGRRLPFAVEVIAFGDEEGSRFPASMLCSRAVAGTLAPQALAVSDRKGITLTQALAAWNMDAANFPLAGRNADSLLGFLEAHIEQGPVLEGEGLALGVVTAIAAQLRLRVEVTGQAAHAGTTAMAYRHDALAAAAEMVLAVERRAQDMAGDLVATVGQMDVAPGAVNVVPGQAGFSLDIRSGDRTLRDRTWADLQAAFQVIAEQRRVAMRWSLLQDLPAVPCDAALTDRLSAALRALGLPERRLVSGAGHDAMVMADLCPAAMLFIRCRGGVSHNPAESVASEDAELALKAMLEFLEIMARD